MSTKIANDFKTIISEYSDFQRPVDYVIGTYTNNGVYIDQDNVIFLQALIVPKEYTDYQVQTSEGEITIYNALKNGEKIILLRKIGGQQYLVLGRI